MGLPAKATGALAEHRPVFLGPGHGSWRCGPPKDSWCSWGTWGDHPEHTTGSPLPPWAVGIPALPQVRGQDCNSEAVTSQGRDWARSQGVSLALGLVLTGVGLRDTEDLGAEF